jgi:hypothetical protein
MNPEQQPDPQGDQPVAYDTQGRPLYYRPEPPVGNQNPQPTTVVASAGADKLTPELQVKHDESVKHYPEIQFSDTEYVVVDVQRTVWGLVLIWFVAIAAFLVILLFATIVSQTGEVNSFTMFMIVVGLGVMCLIGGTIGQWVFRKNYFIVTNERVVAQVQSTPFSHHNQNVELEHIEDCSYRQNGPIQAILNYGTIRLSTIGDEQTYLFTFVARPADQFRIVNKAVQIVDEDQPTKYRL